MPATRPKTLDDYLTTPEMQLLLACCGRVTGVTDEPEITRALARDFDENTFLECCRDHRLIALVFRHLVKPYPDRFSPEVYAAFEGEYRQLQMAHLRMSKAVVDLHREMGGRGVHHLFLKGPVLNQRLFGNEFLRYCGDVDMLVDHGSFEEAHAGMLRLGYIPLLLWWQRAFGLSVRRTHRKDVTYVHPPSGVFVEMHWKTDLVEVSLEGFDWKRDVSICRFHGADVPVFPEDRDFLYLCLHAAKHHWARFRWLLDVAVMLRRPGFDPGVALALAERYGLGGVVEEALWMSQRVFGVEAAPAPGRALEVAGRRAEERFLADRFAFKPLRPLIRTWHGAKIYPRLGQRVTFWRVWLTEWVLVKLPGLPPKRAKSKWSP